MLEPVVVVKVLPPLVITPTRGSVLMALAVLLPDSAATPPEPYRVLEPVVVVSVLPSVVKVATRSEVVTGVPVTVVEPVVVVMVLPSVVRTPTRGRTVAPDPDSVPVALALLEAMEPLALVRTLAAARDVEPEAVVEAADEELLEPVIAKKRMLVI